MLSIGIFFTLMIVGLMSSLPQNLLHGLVAHAFRRGGRPGRPPAPVSTLFAAFLGYDPVQHLIGAHALASSPWPSSTTSPGAGSSRSDQRTVRAGLHAALDFAIVASLLAAGASWLRGGRYVYAEEGRTSPRSNGSTAPAAPTRSKDPNRADGSDRRHRAVSSNRPAP